MWTSTTRKTTSVRQHHELGIPACNSSWWSGPGHISRNSKRYLAQTGIAYVVIGCKRCATATQIIYCKRIQYGKDCYQVCQTPGMNTNNAYYILFNAKECHIQPTSKIVLHNYIETNCLWTGRKVGWGYVHQQSPQSYRSIYNFRGTQLLADKQKKLQVREVIVALEPEDMIMWTSFSILGSHKYIVTARADWNAPHNTTHTRTHEKHHHQ